MACTTTPSHDQRSADGPRPALAVLRCVVAHGDLGMTRKDLAAEGWPTRSVSVPLDALRSRGYVVYDGSTGRWRATVAGRRRVADTVIVAETRARP